MPRRYWRPYSVIFSYFRSVIVFSVQPRKPFLISRIARNMSSNGVQLLLNVSKIQRQEILNVLGKEGIKKSVL